MKIPSVAKPDIGFVIVPTSTKNIGKPANENVDMCTIFGCPLIEVELALKSRGVVTLVLEEWGGLVRAVVATDDGRSAVRFFYPDTLLPVIPSQMD